MVILCELLNREECIAQSLGEGGEVRVYSLSDPSTVTIDSITYQSQAMNQPTNTHTHTHTHTVTCNKVDLFELENDARPVFNPKLNSFTVQGIPT